MSLLRLLFATGILCSSLAIAAQKAPSSAPETHRYLIERTFPEGALGKVDADAKANIIANNTSAHVRWVQSYVNADKTKTFCIYEAPNMQAIRKAAALSKLPIDSITEIPATLSPIQN